MAKFTDAELDLDDSDYSDDSNASNSKWLPVWFDWYFLFAQIYWC